MFNEYDHEYLENEFDPADYDTEIDEIDWDVDHDHILEQQELEDFAQDNMYEYEPWD